MSFSESVGLRTIECIPQTESSNACGCLGFDLDSHVFLIPRFAQFSTSFYYLFPYFREYASEKAEN
jgi:hypothetical protein